MGGRIGSRMEKVLKKEEIGIGAMNNQTVRHDEDSPGIDDEDMHIDDDDDFFKGKPQKNIIEAEPEREPENNKVEGNVTISMLDQE